jgi:hypothetical protein
MGPAQGAAVSEPKPDQLEEVEARLSPRLLAQNGSVGGPLKGCLMGRELCLEAMAVLHPSQQQLQAFLHEEDPPVPSIQPQVLSVEVDCVRLVEASTMVDPHLHRLAPLGGRHIGLDPCLDPRTATRCGAQGAGRAQHPLLDSSVKWHLQSSLTETGRSSEVTSGS